MSGTLHQIAVLHQTFVIEQMHKIKPGRVLQNLYRVARSGQELFKGGNT